MGGRKATSHYPLSFTIPLEYPMSMQRTLIESVYIQLANELAALESDLAQCDEIKSLATLNHITALREQISKLADALQTN